MESELSGIFRVKLVTKNIVRGSPRTQFMHMRVKFHRKEIISKILRFDQISNYASFAKQCHEPRKKNIIPPQDVRICLTHFHP